MERRSDEALVWSPPFAIELGWLDANGHLNMAYYHVMFDRTVDLALEELDFGHAYRARANASVFNVETHVVYRQEVRGDDLVRVSFQLLGCDDKRLHGFQTMVRTSDSELLATSESMFVHVDLAERRSAAIPTDVRRRAKEMMEKHEDVGLPSAAGRRIAPLAAPVA